MHLLGSAVLGRRLLLLDLHHLGVIHVNVGLRGDDPGTGLHHRDVALLSSGHRSQCLVMRSRVILAPGPDVLLLVVDPRDLPVPVPVPVRRTTGEGLGAGRGLHIQWIPLN